MLNVTGVLSEDRPRSQVGNLVWGDASLKVVLLLRDATAQAIPLRGLVGVRLALSPSQLISNRTAAAKPDGPSFAEPSRFACCEAGVRASLCSAVSAQVRRRFLVIKTWEYSFWSDVNHVLDGMLLAQMMSRELTHPVCPAAMHLKLLFEPVLSVVLDDPEQLSDPFFPLKWFASPDLNTSPFHNRSSARRPYASRQSVPELGGQSMKVVYIRSILPRLLWRVGIARRQEQGAPVARNCSELAVQGITRMLLLSRKPIRPSIDLGKLLKSAFG